MPDREKVIQGLEHCRLMCEGVPHNPCQGCLYQGKYDCADTLKTDALTLLKEQEEPKQIIRKQCKKEWEDGSIDYYAEWYCPHCNSLILRGFDNPSIKFCYKCGKPILWEGR